MRCKERLSAHLMNVFWQAKPRLQGGQVDREEEEQEQQLLKLDTAHSEAGAALN